MDCQITTGAIFLYAVTEFPHLTNETFAPTRHRIGQLMNSHHGGFVKHLNEAVDQAIEMMATAHALMIGAKDDPTTTLHLGSKTRAGGLTATVVGVVVVGEITISGTSEHREFLISWDWQMMCGAGPSAPWPLMRDKFALHDLGDCMRVLAHVGMQSS